MNGSIKPVLSVVVVITGDTLSFRCDSTDLAGTLEALLCQNSPPPTEIIVPFHQGVDGIEALVRRFPGVHFMMLSRKVILILRFLEALRVFSGTPKWRWGGGKLMRL